MQAPFYIDPQGCIFPRRKLSCNADSTIEVQRHLIQSQFLKIKRINTFKFKQIYDIFAPGVMSRSRVSKTTEDLSSLDAARSMPWDSMPQLAWFKVWLLRLFFYLKALPLCNEA